MADTETDAAELNVLASLRRKVLHGSSWVMLGRVLTIVLGVLINTILTRLLTPAEFGAYLTSFTLVIVGSVIAQLGLDRAVVRLVSAAIGVGRPGNARAAIRQILLVGTLAAFAGGLTLTLALGPWLSHHVYHSGLVAGLIPLTGGWLVATAVQSLFVETFRGLQRFDRATIYDALLVDILWATAFGLLFVVRSTAEVTTIVAISAAITAVVTIVAGIILFGQTRTLERDGHVTFREIADIAWPSLITNVAIYFLGSGIDLLVLGAFRPQHDVALYGSATRLVTLVATPLWILRGVMPPLIAEMHARGRRSELQRALRAGATLAGLPSMLILVVFILYGKPVMGSLYGSYYERGTAILIILSSARLVAVWAGACGITLIMTGHQKTMMTITVLTGILSVAGGVYMAPRFGAIGVATATATMAVVQNGLQLLFAHRSAGVWTHVELSPRELYRFFSKRGLAALTDRPS